MTAALLGRLRAVDPVRRTGRVRSLFATHVEADGPNVPLGTLCSIECVNDQGAAHYVAEVAKVGDRRITLVPLEEGMPTVSGALVTALGTNRDVLVGKPLLDRVVDALGRPLDGAGPINGAARYSLTAAFPDPLTRCSPTLPLETGVRAIDGLLTLGVGQRVGIFAASGVGKSSLMTQIASQTKADVVIACLVGERGREVEAWWNQGFTAEARARSTMVAATSDQSAPMRVRAVQYAVSLADYWRGRGAHVLLLIDSITRLAMAMREIGLAAGEPPTVRAYTPNVFAFIPKIVERCGALKSGGAITALMTVLSETDDVDDPISEMMKSLLDGHILLSRTLAERGHFPAVDVQRSVSRQAEGLITPDHGDHARKIVEGLSAYDAARTMIDAGLYNRGSNPLLDRAIEQQAAMADFLCQRRSTRVEFAETLTALQRLAMGAGR